MVLKGSCHCGAVRIEVPNAPGLCSDVSQTSSARPWIGSCNCSFCMKIGSLMAYYPDDGGVKIEGVTVPYIWGDSRAQPVRGTGEHGNMISLQTHARTSPGRSPREPCPVCGCFTDWRSTGESYGKVGVNARLLDGFEMREGRCFIEGAEIEVRYLQNAA